MCTRFVLLEEHYRAVLRRLGLAEPEAPFVSRYNLGPGLALPVVRAREGRPEVVAMNWGWTPPWARSPTEKLVNLRAETIAQRAPLRGALRARRCLLPATGFYEWQKRGSQRQPFYFSRRDEQPFGLAAVWHDPPRGAPETGASFAVITTEPNALVRAVHDRMPVMLTLDELPAWLSAEPPAEDQALLARLRPTSADEMTSTPVSPRMNSVRYEAADCIAPVALPPEPPRPAEQFTLGL